MCSLSRSYAQVCLSIVLQFLVHLYCLVTTLEMAKPLLVMSKRDPSFAPDGPFRPNLINTAIFILSAVMQVNLRRRTSRLSQVWFQFTNTNPSCCSFTPMCQTDQHFYSELSWPPLHAESLRKHSFGSSESGTIWLHGPLDFRDFARVECMAAVSPPTHGLPD